VEIVSARSQATGRFLAATASCFSAAYCSSGAETKKKAPPQERSIKKKVLQ